MNRKFKFSLVRKGLGIFLLGGVAFLNISAFAADETPPDLKALCARECPKAKDMKDVMNCVEKKEHAKGPLTAKFKKTDCYITHEKFEDKYNAMAGLKAESEEGEKK